MKNSSFCYIKNIKTIYTVITASILFLAAVTIYFTSAENRKDEDIPGIAKDPQALNTEQTPLPVINELPEETETACIIDTENIATETEKNSVSEESEDIIISEHTTETEYAQSIDESEITTDELIITEKETTEKETNTADTNVIDAILKSINGLDELYPDTVLKKTEDMGEDYIKRIIFLGDSTTYAMKRYGVLENGTKTNQVWTPASGTLTLSNATFSTIVYPDDGSEITIAEAVLRKKPEILVITLGVNGVSFMKEDYFKSSYKALIEEILISSPDTKIILQSIFPIAASYSKKKSINNTKISKANEWIACIADELELKFANTASVLIGSDGYLPEEYQNGDGLHLNKISLSLELEYLRTHALTYEEETDLETETETEINTEETSPKIP